MRRCGDRVKFNSRRFRKALLQLQVFLSQNDVGLNGKISQTGPRGRNTLTDWALKRALLVFISPKFQLTKKQIKNKIGPNYELFVAINSMSFMNFFYPQILRFFSR